MKTGEVRDLMVKRVQEAHKKWPSFDKMPELTQPTKFRVRINGDPKNTQNYVAALYELCGYGAIPSGCYKGDENVIGGDPEVIKKA